LALPVQSVLYFLGKEQNVPSVKYRRQVFMLHTFSFIGLVVPGLQTGTAADSAVVDRMMVAMKSAPSRDFKCFIVFFSLGKDVILPT
jgi:hypothetical protein